MTPPPERSAHILISGRVQGVGFRAWMRDKARGLGLKGWVRNTRDGRVEAVLCGPQTDVEVMLQACRTGPKWARVDHIEHRPDLGTVDNDFSVRATL